MTTEERIIQAKIFLSKASRFPFFGYLLFLLKGRPVKELCPTAGVGRDAQWLYYNPEFIDGLKPEELKAVLVHEVMHCLTPESLVLTEMGLKPIKDIQVGERVWSGQGMFTKVLAKSERNYNGKVYTIKSRFGRPVTFTAEHPILAIKNPHHRKIGHIKALEKRKKHLFGPESFRFINAKELQEGDILSFKLPQQWGERTRKLFKTRNHYKIRKVFLDKDIAYFLGFFVGDGNLSKQKSSGTWFKRGEKFERNIVLTLSLKDDYNRLTEIIKNKFYRSPCLLKVKNKNARRIVFSGKSLAKFLRNNFYSGNQKSIPAWMLYEKKDIIQSFIDGLRDSDGYCTKGGRCSITNTANGVYSFVPLLLMRLGYIPSLSTYKPRNLNHSQPYTIAWQKEPKMVNARFIGKKIIYPVDHIQEKTYKGKVYNLETEAHTFCVPYFTTHNCALQHPWRGVEKDQMLFNIAADICINNDINTYQGMALPKGTLLDSRYKGWFTEKIYYDLKNRMNKATKNGKRPGKMECGFADGKGGEEKKEVDIIPTSQFSQGCRGDHGKWYDKSTSDAQGKKNQKRWQRAVNQAAEIHAKKQGTLPGELQRLVEEAAPKVDWKEVLVNYVVKNHDDYTYRQPDRRFLDSEFIMPSMEEGEKLDEVVIAVDCSGSIGQEELSKFAGEVKGLLSSFAHIKAYMCSWDTQIYEWKELDDWRGDIRYFGGGGTDSRCVFDEIEKRKIDPVVVLMFSDCYASYPDKEPEFDVIWLVPHDHQIPPFGRVILYEQ